MPPQNNSPEKINLGQTPEINTGTVETGEILPKTQLETLSAQEEKAPEFSQGINLAESPKEELVITAETPEAVVEATLKGPEKDFEEIEDLANDPAMAADKFHKKQEAVLGQIYGKSEEAVDKTA